MITICGVSYLDGRDWLDKINLLFKKAYVPKSIITSMEYNHQPNSVTIKIKDYTFKNLAQARLNHTLKSYTGIVFIKK
jgi:hypothetical protein